MPFEVEDYRNQLQHAAHKKDLQVWRDAITMHECRVNNRLALVV